MVKLSMRNSILIWVSGACCGWVLLVAFIYNLLGTSDAGTYPGTQMIAEDPASELNQISPAAGGNPVDEKSSEKKEDDKP